MPVRGVLFDVDDTLVDFSGAEESAVAAHLAALGLLGAFPDAAGALALWREVAEPAYARFLSGELTFTGQRRARVRAFLSHLGQSTDRLPDDDADAWFADYETRHRAAWAAFPDAEPVLARLVSGHRLGVVSNSSSATQRRKLGQVGLLPYLEAAIVCSDEYGEAKPAAGIFRAGCARLGLRPDEVAYVGDHYTIDGVGAREAGLRAFWLDRAGSGVPVEDGVRVISSLAELPAALAR
ncbi:HAD family hydrolase [Actinacidiphila yeochonensis]|uniref:HAD family hydrolase n=1 Tax=Actinacidiphila yeochonensis TaxID=89050 RepID=UPI000562C479|nr:HAD family hydrolase [Actinacidiphila yeochonensis]